MTDSHAITFAAELVKNSEYTSDDILRLALERQPRDPGGLIQSIVDISHDTAYELCLEADVVSRLDDWVAGPEFSAHGGFDDAGEHLRDAFLGATRACQSLRAKALHGSVALAAEHQQQTAAFAAEEAVRKPGEAKSVVRTRAILAQEAALHARNAWNELRIAARTADRIAAGEAPLGDYDLQRRVAEARGRAQSRR